MARKKKHGPDTTVNVVSGRVKHGDTIIETTVRTEAIPATVDYNDILDATEVIPDEEARTPWEDCDGFEHTATPVSQLDDPKREFADKMQGYAWDDGNRERVLIEIDPAQVKKWGVYDHARSRGASKQVAAEMEAKNLQRTLEILVDWYESGWEYWGVSCDYLDEHESLWGIDDYEYAEHDVRHEIAGQVVYELEKKGFTVINKPAKQNSTRYGKQWRLSTNLNSQSFADDAKFSYADAERERTGE